MEYADLKWALEVFGISLPQNFTKIKARQKQLLKKMHPDVSGLDSQKAHEESSRVNRAFEILSEYHEHYKMDFSEKEFYKQYPEAQMKRMMKHDPLWGNGS